MRRIAPLILSVKIAMNVQPSWFITNSQSVKAEPDSTSEIFKQSVGIVRRRRIGIKSNKIKGQGIGGNISLILRVDLLVMHQLKI